MSKKGKIGHIGMSCVLVNTEYLALEHKYRYHRLHYCVSRVKATPFLANYSLMLISIEIETA